MKQHLIKIGLTIATPLLFSFSQPSMAASSSSCNNYSNGICEYTPSFAASYALNYALVDTKFPKYQSLGGNCTNFVSQAILAGLIGNSDKSVVFSKRIYYTADRDKGGDYEWYYGDKIDGKWDKGPAWTGAQEMFQYANSNLDSYWGMHFDFVTRDSRTTGLETDKVEIGDVIFVDWTGDKSIDHTMVVTGKTANSYRGIRVSYQNSDGYTPKRDVTLYSINKLNTVFHVYRPTFYRN